MRSTSGRVLLGAAKSWNAVDALYVALRLDPELPGLHHDLAFALKQMGRFDDAHFPATEASRRSGAQTRSGVRAFAIMRGRPGA